MEGQGRDWRDEGRDEKGMNQNIQALSLDVRRINTNRTKTKLGNYSFDLVEAQIKAKKTKKVITRINQPINIWISKMIQVLFLKFHPIFSTRKLQMYRKG